MELNTRRKIPYLQATMCYFCLLYKHFTNKRKQILRFKKRMRCHSFRALNRATGVSEDDTREKLSYFCICGDIVYSQRRKSLKGTAVYIISM